jgi:hypothetical protein
VVTDFGEPATDLALQLRAEDVRDTSGGWIASTHWENTTGQPITKFSTYWVVPPPPASDDGQEIYLFNGLSPSDNSWILQPVLQWGATPDGGGNSWAIANWYVPAAGSDMPFLVTPLVQVKPGFPANGIMTGTAQADSSFTYECYFAWYTGDKLTVTDIPELTWAYETLECYGISQCSDYPDTAFTSFFGIAMMTGPDADTPIAPDWQPLTERNDCGQDCVIVPDDSTGNTAVEIYYHAPARAVPGSALTCFGAGGSATRLYYFGADQRVNELASQANHFVTPSCPTQPQQGTRWRASARMGPPAACITSPRGKRSAN